MIKQAVFLGMATLATIFSTALIAQDEGKRAGVAGGTLQDLTAEGFVEQLMKLDTNQDGKLSKKEMQEDKVRHFFQRADLDGNEFVTPEELTGLHGREMNNAGGGEGGQDGAGGFAGGGGKGGAGGGSGAGGGGGIGQGGAGGQGGAAGTSGQETRSRTGRGQPGQPGQSGRGGAGGAGGQPGQPGQPGHAGGRGGAGGQPGQPGMPGGNGKRFGTGPSQGMEPPPSHIGVIMPPHIQNALNLSEQQRRQIAELQAMIDNRLSRIMNDDQEQQYDQLKIHNPGPPHDQHEQPMRGEDQRERDGQPAQRKPRGNGTR